VPTTFSGFAKYIDSKNDKFEKEGIWESEDGSYVLGLVRNNSDIRFRYKAFVIESKRPEWKVGDVKMKFSKLDDSDVAAARYFMGNKLEIGATFEASNSALIGISPREPSLIFIKTYSRDEEAKSAGSGSGWHIGNEYLVTNAHVISKAKSINVIIGGNPYGAHATLVDKKLDLAILKIADGHPKMKAIALVNEVASGEKIFAIRYPLGALLGREPKISDGLVGALSGIKGDPTVLSISAPIQPAIAVVRY
jgi:S1-C subfamily serine protease